MIFAWLCREIWPWTVQQAKNNFKLFHNLKVFVSHWPEEKSPLWCCLSLCCHQIHTYGSNYPLPLIIRWMSSNFEGHSGSFISQFFKMKSQFPGLSWSKQEANSDCHIASGGRFICRRKVQKWQSLGGGERRVWSTWAACSSPPPPLCLSCT